MGIFDFLTGKGPGAVQRTVLKANNKDAQSGDRFSSLEQLRTIAEGGGVDGDEAILGLLRRFSFVYSKTIEDEQEKDWVFEALAALGESVLAPLAKNMKNADSISWQLKLLDKVADADKTWVVLEKLVADNDNQYVRDPSKKIQLVYFLGENAGDVRATRALPQYLEDIDETVRFQSVEALVRHKNEDVALSPLVDRLCSTEEESRRIKIRILDGLAEAGWPMGERKAQVESAIAGLGVGFTVDAKSGRVRRS